MGSSNRETVTGVLDRLDAVTDELLGLRFDALTTRQRLTVLERLETVARRLPAPGHELITEIARQATPAELGGNLVHALATRLRITRTDAKRRIGEAADLVSRRSLPGQPLPPVLEVTAAAQRDGALGRDHVAVIRRFYRRLPGWVDAATRASAEQRLAAEATAFRPEQIATLAELLIDCLNHDGTYTDADRARRGLVLAKQGTDGMSTLTGCLTPQLRATLEAVLAKLAAPGMCNAGDAAPTVDGAPPQEAIEADTRSTTQRNHDGLLAGLRALLCSGDLGRHNGLPASIVVTTTLDDLETAAGRGLTAGDTLLPMSEVIRLAGHAHHYLAVFDHGRTLALWHTNRLASPGQRLVLHAKERGCSHPGCDVPGYYCEVHHTNEYAACGRTDIYDLTLACGPHHRLITPDGWQTRKNGHHDTEWTPPTHHDRSRPRVNTFHHPERLLHDNQADDEVP